MKHTDVNVSESIEHPSNKSRILFSSSAHGKFFQGRLYARSLNQANKFQKIEITANMVSN